MRFTIAGIEPLPAAATPTLRLRLAIEAAGGQRIDGMTLAVRVRIAAARRPYTPAETTRLRELFGAAEDLPRSLGPLPWTEATVSVGSFDAATEVEVWLPCTYDFEVVSAKYFAALDDTDVPIEALFSGTLFYRDADGRLQAVRVPWDNEATARLPLAVWRAAVDAAFPQSAWLRLDRALFTRLLEHRERAGDTSWDQTLAALLDRAGS